MGLAIWLFAVFCAVIVLRIAWLGFVHYKRRRSPQNHRHLNHSHNYQSQHHHDVHAFSAWHDARYIDDDRTARHGPSSGWNLPGHHSSGGWSGGGSNSGGWGSGGGDSGSWGGSESSSSSD